VQYPNASFFRTILHLECDPSFGPGSNKYRLTFDCPKLFSKYAGAGAAKSTRETSLINRCIVSFFRTFLPFIRVFFIPLSSIIFFSSFVFVFVVILKGEGGGGGGGGFAAKALILTRKLSSGRMRRRARTREKEKSREKSNQNVCLTGKFKKKKWRFGEKKKGKKRRKKPHKTHRLKRTLTHT